MKTKKEIEMLMKSLKYNLGTSISTGLIQEGDNHEEYLLTQIGILAWVLGIDDISTHFPEHYSKEGSHQIGSDYAKVVVRKIEDRMMFKKLRDGKLRL